MKNKIKLLGFCIFILALFLISGCGDNSEEVIECKNNLINYNIIANCKNNFCYSKGLIGLARENETTNSFTCEIENNPYNGAVWNQLIIISTVDCIDNNSEIHTFKTECGSLRYQSWEYFKR